MNDVDDLLYAAEAIETYLETGTVPKIKRRDRANNDPVPFPHADECPKSNHDHGTNCDAKCPTCHGNALDV